MSIDLGFSGTVILILLIVILTVVITSKFVRSSVAKAAEPARVEAPRPVPVSLPIVQTGIEEETVAAIIAAISCMSGGLTGVQYSVRSISRAKESRPVWGFAGMQQNTRPF